ncbi:flavin reductase family protein [Leifsonia sp. AG29]|uniref:flavin reductase family protein n=1 Tax=Leifsonia sp. AG29 TaxID=2598860 RepID=UPI0018EF18B4|nr:flavin reductase family protein [Leifsonia sp. AG29]
MNERPIEHGTIEHVTIEPEVLYVGTPAFLIVTVNDDGTPNLAPASSYWALGRMLVLGIEADGQTAHNALQQPDLTVNFPSGDQWRALHSLSSLTGRHPVPEAKAKRYRHEPDKFSAAGLTAQPSEVVAAPRVAECRLQFEARLERATPSADGSYYLFEARALRVHADPAIVDAASGQIDPRRWDPIVYSFRHFFRRGEELGWLPSSPIERG